MAVRELVARQGDSEPRPLRHRTHIAARPEWPLGNHVERLHAEQRLRRLADMRQRRGEMEIGGAGDAAVARIAPEVEAHRLAAGDEAQGTADAAVDVDIGTERV